MNKISTFHSSLTDERERILKSIILFFQDKAIEAHIFGSTARGNADAYSDIDIWFTFKDENTAKALAKRFEYYSLIGEIIHVCEPPQNSPINGVHSCVIYRTESVIHSFIDFS